MTRHHDRLTRSRFSIGAAQVQPDRLIILFDGEEHSVEPKVMDVLVVLAENAGETLPTERIILLAWKSDGYGDNPVHKAINALRKVFADDPKRPRYIETIRGRGYRLVATVNFPSGYRRIQAQGRTWLSGSPYVGLDAFDASHAEVFFGRSRTTADLLAAMRRQIDQQRRLVLVVGASGCGKTSLLRAGAIPLIANENGFDGLHALSVARCDLAGADDKDALLRLAMSLQRWTLDGRQVFPPQPPAGLAKTLSQHAESITGTLAEAFRRHLSHKRTEQSHAHLLLVIDHAEALVARQPQDPEANAALDRIIHHLCDSSGICMVMIVREDFHHALAEAFPSIADRMSGDGYLPVLSPRAGEISDIIRVPAARAGLDFERHPESGIYLDDALLAAAAPHPDVLPLLQHTLQMLYERRRDGNKLCFNVYEEAGGLEGALAHHAERTFDKLPEDIRGSLDHILSRIVVMHPENDSVSSRRVIRATLDEKAVMLAEAFAKARLFVAEQGENGPDYRVTHEALLRQWPRATQWIRDNQQILLARIRLQHAAKRWDQEGRRDDHLLNSEMQLSDAIKIEKTHANDLSLIDNDYIIASERHISRKRMLRKLAVSALSGLTIASVALSILAFKAQADAIARKNETLQLIDFMLSRLGNELRARGDIKLLGAVSSEALSVLEVKPIDEMTAPELVQHARSLLTICEVSLKKGAVDDAENAARGAREAATRAMKLSPESIDALNENAQSLFWLGEISRTRSRRDEALEHWKHSLRDIKQLALVDPDRTQWKLEHSYTLNNIGALLSDMGRHDEAMAHFILSRDIKQRLLEEDPENDSMKKDLLDTHSWISSTHEAMGRIDEARAGYEIQISMAREIILRNEKALAWKRWLANALIRHATVLAYTGNQRMAQQDLLESIRILERVIEDAPENAHWLRDLSLANMKAADIAVDLRDSANANHHYDRAASIANKLAAMSSSTIEWQKFQILIELRRASLLPADEDLHSRTNSGINALAELHASHPNDDSLTEALASSLMDRALHHISCNRTDLAHADATRVIFLLTPIMHRSKSPASTSYWVAAHLLLGRESEVGKMHAWLNSIGYQDKRLRAASDLLPALEAVPDSLEDMPGK